MVLRQLDDLLQGIADVVDRWFWLRYDTPSLGPHLRIRFRGRPEDLTGHLQPRLTAFAVRTEELRLSRGLHVELYVQEIERYGGQGAIAAAEQVFAADSAFALLALAHTDGDDRLRTAVVSAADIVRSLTDTECESALRAGPLTPEDRHRRDALRPQLGVPCDPTSLIPAQLGASWAQRQNALTAYRRALTGEEVSALCASDLVHMHCNRLLGTDQALERIVRSLAIDLLHRDPYERRH